ncbi:MAG: hypothetical protein B7733_15045 [Myxococcales bacterium FL481]|nr:MAG: hypothetical protein B7733_15045 [Myxococcales bacterium FL481]
MHRHVLRSVLQSGLLWEIWLAAAATTDLLIVFPMKPKPQRYQGRLKTRQFLGVFPTREFWFGEVRGSELFFQNGLAKLAILVGLPISFVLGLFFESSLVSGFAVPLSWVVVAGFFENRVRKQLALPGEAIESLGAAADK